MWSTELFYLKIQVPCGTSLSVKQRAEEVTLGELHCSIDLLYSSQFKTNTPKQKNKVMHNTTVRLYFAPALVFCKKPKAVKAILHTTNGKF